MSLLDLFHYFEATAIGSAIRNSVWYFAAIEAVHLLGLAVLGGTVLVGDLRLMGVVLPNTSQANVIRQLRPWMVAAIVTMFVTGIPLMLAVAIRCYAAPAFWIKMAALLLAILFVFLVRNPMVLKRENDVALGSARVLAICSIVLWFTVAAAGRWIGFS